MFDRQEIVAMAWGYAFAVPCAVAAIYFGAPVIVAAPIMMVGFLVTMLKLNLSN